MVTKIYIEDQLIDLFSDETMELNSSIANTDDITKINSDYTKTFTVPASDNNNFIFKHYYNADIDNTFDARTKKSAKIELDGLPFRTGKIRLEKVSVKKGKASSYTINFWGDLVNFKDLIKDDELSSLPLDIYEHEHNSANVKLGLTSSLFSGDIIYPLLVKKQLFYNSTGDNVNTDVLANIAYDGGSSTGVIWNELRPGISLLALVELIETKYGITFTRQFFGRDEFKNIYLWVNNDKESNYFNEKTLQIDFTSKGNIEDFAGNIIDLTDNFYVCNSTTLSRLYVNIIPSVGYENVVYSVTRQLDGQDWSSYGELVGVNSLYFRTDRDAKKHTFFVRSRNEFKFTTELVVVAFSGGSKTATQNEQTIPGNSAVLTSMPKIKIIDFIKGICSMFKLVLIPDSDGTIYVNTLKDYYKEGNVYDITKYVDFDSYDVNRGVLKNQINFKYQDPTTILNKQFKINTTIAYGDELLSLSDENGNPLDGDSLDVSLPFEVVLFERLLDLSDGSKTNIQYGAIIDENLEKVNPKPVLFYNNVSQLGSNKVSFINDVGGREILNSNLNIPSMELGTENPEFTLTFGQEFSSWNNVANVGTLFYNYWLEYISAIFNIKKRGFKFKAFLPIALLTKLQLNDILFIKERYYRFNDFTVNLLNGETNMNLVNSFESNFGLFLPSSTQIFLSYKEQSYTVFVSNGSVMNIVLQDLGYGTSWATVTQIGSNIVIYVEENTLIENRDLFINIDNGSGKSFQIYLNQDNKIVTFDTTIQTFDDTILTFDAE